MKTVSLVSILLLLFTFVITYEAIAQKAPVSIPVIEGQYMKGLAYVSNIPLKNTEVKFTSDLVKVAIPNGNQSIMLEIINSDCQAYCSRVKRVRQLNSGDEKLLRNLINKEKNNIFTQLKTAGLKL